MLINKSLDRRVCLSQCSLTCECLVLVLLEEKKKTELEASGCVIFRVSEWGVWPSRSAAWAWERRCLLHEQQVQVVCLGEFNHPSDVPQKYIAGQGVGFLSGLCSVKLLTVCKQYSGCETELVYHWQEKKPFPHPEALSLTSGTKCSHPLTLAFFVLFCFKMQISLVLESPFGFSRLIINSSEWQEIASAESEVGICRRVKFCCWRTEEMGRNEIFLSHFSAPSLHGDQH